MFSHFDTRTRRTPVYNPRKPLLQSWLEPTGSPQSWSAMGVVFTIVNLVSGAPPSWAIWSGIAESGFGAVLIMSLAVRGIRQDRRRRRDTRVSNLSAGRSRDRRGSRTEKGNQAMGHISVKQTGSNLSLKY